MRIQTALLAFGSIAVLAFGLLMSASAYAEQTATSPFGLLSTSPDSADFMLTRGGGHHGGGHHGGHHRGVRGHHGRHGHHHFGHHHWGRHGFAHHHGWHRHRHGGFWWGGTYYGTNCDWRWSKYLNKWVCANYY